MMYTIISYLFIYILMFLMINFSFLCRFEILKHVRHDHIDLLPLPSRVKGYLQEAQYYAETLEEEEEGEEDDDEDNNQ